MNNTIISTPTVLNPSEKAALLRTELPDTTIDTDAMPRQALATITGSEILPLHFGNHFYIGPFDGTPYVLWLRDNAPTRRYRDRYYNKTTGGYTAGQTLVFEARAFDGAQHDPTVVAFRREKGV